MSEPAGRQSLKKKKMRMRQERVKRSGERPRGREVGWVDEKERDKTHLGGDGRMERWGILKPYRLKGKEFTDMENLLHGRSEG